MLDFAAAQELLISHANLPDQSEEIALAQLNGRILAHNIVASLDNPPANNSAMDGYAININDLNSNQELVLQDHVYAGQTPDPLKPNHAMRIFTGGLIPAGANCVVIQENCLVTDKQLHINGSPKINDYIRHQGEDMAKGSIILNQGTRIHSGHIGVLAAQGYAKAKVFKKLTVGILSTGDELCEPGKPLPDAAIYNSNSAMLASLCSNLGITDLIIKHAPDDLPKITDTIAELGQQCDLVLTVGGISVGAKDFIKPAIENLGGQLDLWRVQMKPGKPVALAHINKKLLLALPGNPVSAFAVFALLASPLIRKLQGEAQFYRPVRRGLIKLDQPINNGSRTDFIRVQAQQGETGLPQLVPYHLQSSGAASSLAWADGLAMIPAGATVPSGSELNWYSIRDWLF